MLLQHICSLRTQVQVAQDIVAELGLQPRAVPMQQVQDRPFNDRRYCARDDHKMAALGWRERTSWQEGLRRTVDWYRAIAASPAGPAAYFDNAGAAAVARALQPHPVLGLGADAAAHYQSSSMRATA